MWRLRQSVQVEWRIATVCAGFLIGVLFAPRLQVPVWLGLCATLTCTGLFLLSRLYVAILLFFVSIIAGQGYGSAVFIYNYKTYEPLIGEVVELTGRVKEDVARDAKGQQSLQLGSIQVRGSPIGGSVYVKLRAGKEVLRSDKVTLRGVATPGFGNFSLNLKDASITSIQRTPTDDIGRVARDWFASHVRMLIPEPAASLGVGYLTGQKSALPDDLSDALKVAGLTHIVVASGYNLTVLVRLARRLFMPISKFSAAVAAVVMVMSFVLITGLSPSMTRAGIVSALSILFWYYGRKVHPVVLLLFVAALTVMYQPSYLWGDLGWQLSFAAFFGVMIIGPLMQCYFYGNARINVIQQTLIETIAAHIATIPIIALQFGAISNVAIVANLLVVPLVPLAMLLTFVTGLWALLGVGWSDIIVMPTAKLLEYMVGVAHYVADIDWAQSELSAAGPLWVIYTCAVLGACLWMKRATGYNLRTSDALSMPRGNLSRSG